MFSSLLGVYRRQLRTIGGAILQHMSLSHQRYTTWASMMVYRMRAHEQLLNRSMEEVGRRYDRAFQSTSRAIRHSHAMLVCSRLNEAYASAGAQKHHIFSQWSALSTERHVTRLWVHWVTITKQWREVAWREKGRPSPGRRNNGPQGRATEAPLLVISRRPVWKSPKAPSLEPQRGPTDWLPRQSP